MGEQYIFNTLKDLDYFLSTGSIIPKYLFLNFLDSYNYGTATPMQWLIGRLSIIKQRIYNNEIIKLYNGYILDKNNFKKWILNYFPDLFNDIFLNN